MTSSRRLLGFTLIEVMIAVVILAVGLSSLFVSEAGAVKMAQRARTTTIATLLARCKMAEIEERIAKEGWPGDSLDDRDECCKDGEHEGYSCEWKVERIKLPDMQEGADGGAGGGSDDGEGKGDDKSKAKPTGVLDQMAEMKKSGDPTERLGSITDMLSGGGLTGGTSGELDGDPDGGMGESTMDPMASMGMEMAFPVLKPVIEEGVRRASVNVKWKEGDRERNFEVVQFLVSEQQLILPDSDDESATGAPGTTPPGTTPPGGTKTPTPSPGSPR